MTQEKIDIEIDGESLSVEPGKMLIQVADEAGIRIPRFCYHKKLTVAANCRMCLVDVDKVPKPLPACATQVTPGMVVRTKSKRARDAQKAVMEFLLINHPLDCPICDQGGQCELQDVAMGYGKDVSRFTEGKRAVKDKDIGSLVATEMTRCIHCTRCVRFGTEVAGMSEMGATGRGEDTEIGTFVKHALVSEVSGNIIDLCPVGALTSKPFRFTARPWELERQASIAGHDCVGSHLNHHTRRNQVMRAVPRECEEINETWLSDRDRFSYQGFNSESRLQSPMIKTNDKWAEVDWLTALNFVLHSLQKVLEAHTITNLGALTSSNITLEEAYLFQKLIRALGSNNIDYRLRQSDFTGQNKQTAYPSMALDVETIEQQDSIFLIGSILQLEQPIANLRVRKAVNNGATVASLHSLDHQFNYQVKNKIITRPSHYLKELASIAKSICELQQQDCPATLSSVNISDCHKLIAQQLIAGKQNCLIIGEAIQQHPQYTSLLDIIYFIAEKTNASVNIMTPGANAQGLWLAGAVPHRQTGGDAINKPGLDAKRMLEARLKAYILLNTEPELDSLYPKLAKTALDDAEFVISISPYVSDEMLNYANVLLPSSPHSETSGTFINGWGQWQSFTGSVKPLGEARPAWKILRVLGNLFELDGFEYTATTELREEVRTKCENFAISRESNLNDIKFTDKTDGLSRITHWPIYRVDNTVRRSEALQQTPLNPEPAVLIHTDTAAQLKLEDGCRVRVKQANDSLELTVQIDNTVYPNCVSIPAGFLETSEISDPFADVSLELIKN